MLFDVDLNLRADASQLITFKLRTNLLDYNNDEIKQAVLSCAFPYPVKLKVSIGLKYTVEKIEKLLFKMLSRELNLFKNAEKHRSLVKYSYCNTIMSSRWLFVNDWLCGCSCGLFVCLILACEFKRKSTLETNSFTFSHFVISLFLWSRLFWLDNEMYA